jgi:GMP synthase-like glutamine amidotransferase
MRPRPVRVAIIDLYNRFPNEGMRAIRALVASNAHLAGEAGFEVEIFETRFDGSVPDASFDIYVSTGGPGSPFDGQGKAWERDYFRWIDSIREHNVRGTGTPRSVLFICHSFQLMVRHFGVASVVPRGSRSFGIFKVHPTVSGRKDPLFDGLGSPFYAADFRDWQAVQPNHDRLDELGGAILAIEKRRDYIPLERAVMAIRISPHLVGVQFHPEAEPAGMRRHFTKPDLADKVVMDHGREKYDQMLARMDDPEILKRTHDAIIPQFFRGAVAKALIASTERA